MEFKALNKSFNWVHVLFQLENLGLGENMLTAPEHAGMWTCEGALKELKAWPDLGKLAGATCFPSV